MISFLSQEGCVVDWVTATVLRCCTFKMKKVITAINTLKLEKQD